MSAISALIFYPGEVSYVGLWRQDHHQAWITQTVDRTQAGNAVLLAVDQLLTSQSVQLQDVTHIGALAGPASYTQLRVMITTANGLAWALHIPLFSFGLDDSLPHDILRLVAEAPVGALIDPVYPHTLA